MQQPTNRRVITTVRPPWGMKSPSPTSGYPAQGTCTRKMRWAPMTSGLVKHRDYVRDSLCVTGSQDSALERWIHSFTCSGSSTEAVVRKVPGLPMNEIHWLILGHGPEGQRSVERSLRMETLVGTIFFSLLLPHGQVLVGAILDTLYLLC